MRYPPYSEAAHGFKEGSGLRQISMQGHFALLVQNACYMFGRSTPCAQSREWWATLKPTGSLPECKLINELLLLLVTLTEI